MARHQVMGLPKLLMLLLLPILLIVVIPASAESKCLCQVSGCLCCVELNLTSSIDLGGPACVNIRQNERNVSLNLSYADNPVHNATITLDAAARKPTCMNLLSDLAQICAEFVSMQAPTQGKYGYQGCLVIEPALLGTPQATYPVGCFLLDRGQVLQVEAPNAFSELQQGEKHEQQEEQDDEEEDQGLNAEELLAAVSASAEQGIALFSQWLGLNLAPKLNITNGSSGKDESKRPERLLGNTNFTAGRQSRTITILDQSEDRSEERFKQLLSAQDNIMKESATIGESSKGLSTAFLYSQPDAQEPYVSNLEPVATISPENLAIVPSESRRGGRAYSIHQHVNEV